MSTDEKTPTHYELPVGAVALLEDILPSPAWYKDDPKQGATLVRAVAALDALPDTPSRPTPTKDEPRDSFESRVEEWASPVLEFEWSDKQKDAVKRCVSHYLKQGNFAVTRYTVSLLKLLGLDDE